MKKNFILLFFVLCIFVISGCNKKTSEKNTEISTKLENITTNITTSKKTTIKEIETTNNSSTKDKTSTSLTKEKEETYKFPDFYIYTQNGRAINSKETYIDCTISVLNTENNKYNLTQVKAGIRGRGNSTWNWNKKPYRIKFEEKIDLFGNGKAKSWTLIANHCDLSLSRNYYAYNIGNILDDLKYVSSTEFINLYLNGAYQGVYLVCEQVQTGKNRVDIEETLSTDPADTGYFIEMDVKDRVVSEGKVEGKDFFILGSDTSKAYVLKTPDTEDEAYDLKYFNYIKDYFNDVYSILKQSKTHENYLSLSELIDVDTFADTYIVSELFNNCDVGWSMYMYKDKNGKLSSGPIWDFDISSGNCAYQINSCNPSNMWARGGSFWYSTLLSYSDFNDLVKEKLTKYKDLITEKIESITTELLKYEDEFNRNFTRWNILSTGINMGESPISTDEILALESWKNNLLYLEEWLKNSLDAMCEFYEIN